MAGRGIQRRDFRKDEKKKKKGAVQTESIVSRPVIAQPELIRKPKDKNKGEDK